MRSNRARRGRRGDAQQPSEARPQKIVIRVHVRCDKCRSKALGVAATMHGVESMAIEGEDKNQLVVVGDGVDSVELTKCLRKKLDGADLPKVETVSSEKPKPKLAPTTTVTPCTQQWYPSYYYGYYPPLTSVHYYC
ncbi:hypothetical protein ABZP36_003554 [Zizania latifolia]